MTSNQLRVDAVQKASPIGKPFLIELRAVVEYLAATERTFKAEIPDGWNLGPVTLWDPIEVVADWAGIPRSGIIGGCDVQSVRSSLMYLWDEMIREETSLDMFMAQLSIWRDTFSKIELS